MEPIEPAEEERQTPRLDTGKFGPAELAAKAMGLLVFGASFIHEATAVFRGVWAGLGTGGDLDWHRLALNLSNMLFLGLIVVLYARRPRATAKAHGVLPRILGLAGTFGLPLALFWLPASPPTWAGVVGPLLVVSGHVLAFITLAVLGRSFSIMAEARNLVTSGPYAIVRHPLYLAEELAAIGLFLQKATLPAGMVLLAHLVVQILRMRNEERVLLSTFPEYAAYRSRTRAFLPGLL